MLDSTRHVDTNPEPQNHNMFELLLYENFSPRTFKNRPIWSHCKVRSLPMASLIMFKDQYDQFRQNFANLVNNVKTVVNFEVYV